jgi:hypothetical protein
MKRFTILLLLIISQLFLGIFAQTYDCATKYGTFFMPTGENVSYPFQSHISQMVEIFGHCDCASMKELIGNPFLKFSHSYYPDDPSRCDCGMEQVDYRAPPGINPQDWYAQTEFNPFIETYLLPMALCNYPQCPNISAVWPGLMMIDGGYVTSDFYTKTLSESLPTGESLYAHVWSINKRTIAQFNINVLDPHYYELSVTRGRPGKHVLYVKINMPEDILGDMDDSFPTMNQYGFASKSTYQSNQTIIHMWNRESDIWRPARDTPWYKVDFTPVIVYNLLQGSEDDCCFWPMASFS